MKNYTEFISSTWQSTLLLGKLGDGFKCKRRGQDGPAPCQPGISALSWKAMRRYCQCCHFHCVECSIFLYQEADTVSEAAEIERYAGTEIPAGSPAPTCQVEAHTVAGFGGPNRRICPLWTFLSYLSQMKLTNLCVSLSVYYICGCVLSYSALLFSDGKAEGTADFYCDRLCHACGIHGAKRAMNAICPSMYAPFAKMTLSPPSITPRSLW